MDDLSSLLSAGDSRAIARSRALGAEALATLEAHLAHADPDVRFLAVECLASLGSAEAGRLLLTRAEDASEEVRLEAVNALLESEAIAGMGPGLTRAFDRTPDGFLRKQLALVLGRLGAEESRSRLAGRLVGNDLARDGLVAGLARLGDPLGRARLTELLRSAEGERVPEVLALFRYAARVEATPDLLPLIELEEIVLDLSTHVHTVKRRACDLAVDEFLRLRPGELSFGQRPIQEPYSYTELVEIKTLLRREAEQT